MDLAGSREDREKWEHLTFKDDGMFLFRMSTAVMKDYLGWLSHEQVLWKTSC